MKLGTGDKVIKKDKDGSIDTRSTISKHGMAKERRLGSGEMVSVVDETTGKESVDENGELVVERDGYRRTNRGTKGFEQCQ